MAVFWLRLTTFVTGVFVRRFESCWFDDVCNVGRPLVARPGPVGQLGRLSETVVAFEGAGRVSTETAIAFTGVKCVFLVQFSGAVVMSVSAVPCWG